MFVRLNDQYIPLDQCHIDARQPDRIVVRLPWGLPLTFTGPPAKALLAALSLLKEGGRVMDLEELFNSTTGQETAPTVKLPKTLPPLTLPPFA